MKGKPLPFLITPSVFKQLLRQCWHVNVLSGDSAIDKDDEVLFALMDDETIAQRFGTTRPVDEKAELNKDG
ncbi:hypothetical protein CABS01_02809 [Colletotrichum abscissum]|uniref:Uncharacterized protein n=1 Tax=Colletotrichum abscissum TaxID=1671311 RepID=A0A9P9XKS1_9PEZI|nr:uncharacterized protein CABS01_02809 [Colletotrichum abscissum]KAI3555659.1 hypothetical protein CABS02_04035 [Colletotrichum abscissum]KAK1483073.1 hypothetical protein CABS01_02809 [Colletotrichum abscissum]